MNIARYALHIINLIYKREQTCYLMDSSDRYFIKKGYQVNIINRTLDSSDSTYWSEWRIKASHYYQYHVYALAKRLIRERKLNNVLDIGCGVATKLMELIYPVCCDVVGVDQPYAIEICKKKYGNGKFYSDNLEAPNLKLNRIFDLIICSDVIEHLLDPDKLLKYIKNLSHYNSLIIFSTPERDLLRGSGCMASCKPEHIREWNQKEFLKYLQSRGFEIILSKIVPPSKLNFSRDYYLFLKRVLKGMHPLNTTQIVIAQL